MGKKVFTVLMMKIQLYVNPVYNLPSVDTMQQCHGLFPFLVYQYTLISPLIQYPPNSQGQLQTCPEILLRHTEPILLLICQYQILPPLKDTYIESF